MIADYQYFRLPGAQLAGLVHVTEEARQAEVLKPNPILLVVPDLPAGVGVGEAQVRVILSEESSKAQWIYSHGRGIRS